MAHTPGPWRAKPDAGEIVLNGSSIYRVRDVPSDRFNPADIRLLAAAPELYAACLALRASLADWIDIQDRDDERTEDDKALAFADAAIDKAEGRTDEE